MANNMAVYLKQVIENRRKQLAKASLVSGSSSQESDKSDSDWEEKYSRRPHLTSLLVQAKFIVSTDNQFFILSPLE